MNKKALIEAALFMSAKPLSIEELEKLSGLNKEDVKNIIEELINDYESEERGIHLLKIGETYKFYVKPQYIRYVRHLTPYSDMKKGLLKVLALVAYKNGITQSEIVKVIGNRTYEYVRELENRRLIKTVKEGRTKVLVPTKEFAEYFGLKDPEEIKRFFKGVLNEEGDNSS